MATGPGATQLVRIPSGPWSSASARVSALRAHPRAPYLRLVVSRDKLAPRNFDAARVSPATVEVIGPATGGDEHNRQI